METTLSFKTPLWKEIAIISFMTLLAAFGAFLAYLGYTSGELIASALGVLLVLIGVPAAILEAMSRTVLQLDAEGVYMHPQLFGKKQRISWNNISGFDKVVQTLKSARYTDSTTVTYLVISLKEVPEANSASVQLTSSLNNALYADATLDKPYKAGDIYFPSLRLPGRVDDILRQVREYHARVTGEPVVPTYDSPKQKKKLVTVWVFATVIALFLGMFLLTASTGKPLVDVGADVILFIQGVFRG